MQLKENIISQGHGFLAPSYVVIHETANPGATAKNHVDYWSRDDTYAVHYVGDWTGDCYHCVPNNRLCWQVGNGNSKVVGIELCHATNQADFEKVWQLGVEWSVFMLRKYGWGVDRLISHNDATMWWGGSDHTDPIGYFQEYGKSWAQFKEEVAKAMNGKGEWIKDATGWWYKRADGSYPANGWEKINEKWYYFNASGYMQTGWIKWNRQWFYCSEAAKDEGAMVTGWRKIKYKGRDEWFYFADSGAMYGEGFYLIGGKWYGFDIKGRMLDKEDKLQITDSGNIEVVA